MAGTIKIDTIQSELTTPTVFKNSSGTEIGQLCKAWLQVGGGASTTAGTAAGSFNISSVTVNGTGDQTANFTTSVASSAFSGLTRGDFFSSTSTASHGVAGSQTGYYQTTSFRYGHQQYNSYCTFTYMSIAIFR